MIKELSALMNPTRWAWLIGIAAAALVGIVTSLVVVYDRGHTNGLQAGELKLKASYLAIEQQRNSDMVRQRNQIDQLITANEENQRAYAKSLSELAAADGLYDSSAGVRDQQRAAITAAARGAAAGACDRAASLFEQHIAGVEADADQMGRLAVRALAKSETLERTLRDRRDAIAAQRKALKPSKE